MQNPHKSQAEPEAQRLGRFALVVERRIGQIQFFQCLAQQRKIGRFHREDTGEYNGFCVLVPGERHLRGPFGQRNGVAHFYLVNVFNPGDQIAHFSGGKFIALVELFGRHKTDFFGFVRRAGRHKLNRLARFDGAVYNADVHNYAAERVVIRVEN